MKCQWLLPSNLHHHYLHPQWERPRPISRHLKVGTLQATEAVLQLYRGFGEGSSGGSVKDGDWGSHLDSDLALSEQPEELALLKADP